MTFVLSFTIKFTRSVSIILDDGERTGLLHMFPVHSDPDPFTQSHLSDSVSMEVSCEAVVSSDSSYYCKTSYSLGCSGIQCSPTRTWAISYLNLVVRIIQKFHL